MHNRVIEVKEIWEQDGYKVEPTFGTSIPLPGDKIKQITDTPLQESVQGPTGETGERGPQGYSVQYSWDGTQLGIKREDETSYIYADLRGPQGIQGLKGDTWRPTVDSNGNISWVLNNGITIPTSMNIKGPKGDVGVTGQTGANGFTWRPSIDSNGNLSWVNNGSATIPTTINIKGPQGIQGVQGKSLEFMWNGTQLGIRVEGQTAYTYVELKGQKGDQGIQGSQGLPGKDATQIIKSSTQPTGVATGTVWI